ncbi:hypothetical protein OXX59_003307 [Metschnikowia pulcherrima]
MESILSTYTILKSDSLPKYSDKCILPPSLLEEAIAAHEPLPHPMVFSLSNHIYIGVREFTAPENTIYVPEEIYTRIGSETATCVLESSLPKATTLRIRPSQFYPQVTNWKYYLESFLSSQYTTLTENQNFGHNDSIIGVDVEMMVESSNAPTVVVVDTDISLDVAPLNDIMAAQQLEQESMISKFESVPELSTNVNVDLEPYNKAVHPSMYKINLLRFPKTLEISIRTSDDKFNVDLVCGLDKLISLENFLWSTMGQENGEARKIIHIDSTSDMLTNSKLKHASTGEFWLYVVPFAWELNATVNLAVSEKFETDQSQQNETSPGSLNGKVQCENCHTYIDSSKLQLHEAFCLRHNVRCSCGEVFPKTIPSTHWHCENCDAHGESALHKFKHDKLFHNGPYICGKCEDDTSFNDLLELVTCHKATVCAAKLHECQFCHLIVPQGKATFEDRFQNLTHHENDCGNKTAECFQCGKVLRNKELASHMKMHDLVKVQKNAEVIPKCANANCVNILPVQQNELDLCDTCFGPLYLSVLDPNNMKLQARIERRYVLQLTKGCGNSWCRNMECANGNTKFDFKQALARVKSELFSHIARPALPANAGKKLAAYNTFWFCVSEKMQAKKNLADKLKAESSYGENMIYKAVAARGEEGAREWLAINAM